MKKMLKLTKTLLLLIILSTLFTCKQSYTNQWETFETELILKEKSFQNYGDFIDIKNDFKLVNYPSKGMQLKALLNTKHIDSSKKKPVIVYLHGGFALSYNQEENTKAFTDKGYIVFAPSYRGENGNPGNFELFMGEVEDAKAAINWIANQPYVDKDRIYVFGWSVGGGIALNLAFHDDLPIKLSASSAGLYDLNLIKQWATQDDMIKFPYDHKNER
jgi:acetyl esterase/lipase